MSITFKEDTHQYFNQDGEEYISATTFLHRYQEPFDKENISRFVAKKRGVTQMEVLNEWEENSKKACSFGTEVHEAMEKYIKTAEINETYASLINSFDSLIGKDLDSSKKVLSEFLLWNDDYRIAGTADLIIEHDDKEFSVGDFKTNKAYRYFSQYKKHLLEPVSHLSDCEFNLYGLQLSLYAYFYSLISNKKVRHLFNLYKNGDSWQFIPCNYMEHEIRVMLKLWKKQLDNGEVSTKKQH